MRQVRVVPNKWYYHFHDKIITNAEKSLNKGFVNKLSIFFIPKMTNSDGNSIAFQSGIMYNF